MTRRLNSTLCWIVGGALACSSPAEQEPERTRQPIVASACELAPGGERSPETERYLRAGSELLSRARVSFDPGDYARANACVDRALEVEPELRGALRMRGLIMLNEHRFVEARDLSRRLVESDPEDALSWGTLSDAQLELGELAGAIEAAQRMMDLKPNLPSYGRAAHLRWLQGDTQGAKRLYELAIAVGSAQRDREPRAWMVVEAARLFWHEGDYAGADAGFDLALRDVADYAPALEGKGRVALSRGEYAAAAGWLSRSLAARPLAETAWLLGDAYALAGNPVEAAEAYARVEREGAHDPRTLALFLTTQGRDAERAVRLARSEYAARQDIYSIDALAFALYRAGEHVEADRLAGAATAAGTPDARLLYHAGLIKRALGDQSAGNELVAKALRLNPRFDPMLLSPPGAVLAQRSSADTEARP